MISVKWFAPEGEDPRVEVAYPGSIFGRSRSRAAGVLVLKPWEAREIRNMLNATLSQMEKAGMKETYF